MVRLEERSGLDGSCFESYIFTMQTVIALAVETVLVHLMLCFQSAFPCWNCCMLGNRVSVARIHLKEMESTLHHFPLQAAYSLLLKY